MRSTVPALILVLAAGVALAGSESQEASETVLIEQPLDGMEGKVVHAVRTDIPPGWQTPRHSHPANVFVYVLEGAVEVELEGGETHTATAGEIIYETPGTPPGPPWSAATSAPRRARASSSSMWARRASR